MAIFGSYIGKDHALLGESMNIALLDTFVAITSGLIFSRHVSHSMLTRLPDRA